MNNKIGFLLRRCLRESLYLFVSWPLALLYFILTVTLISVSSSLIVIWVGLPLLVFSLVCAAGFAATERGRACMVGVGIENPPKPGAGLPKNQRGGIWRRWRRRLSDGPSWMAVLHHFIMLPISSITWSILITWWAGAVGGLTAGIWQPFNERLIITETVPMPVPPVPPIGADPPELPIIEVAVPRNLGLADLLHLPISNSMLYTLFGMFFVVTAPWVIHGMTVMQTSITKGLLSPSKRSMERTIASLEQSKTAAVDAELISMRKLERDLHDGPQQRLIRLGMDLSTAERRLDTGDVEKARGVINEAKSHVEETLHELRNLSRGIAPPILVDRGLVTALTSLAANSTVPVIFDTSVAEGTRLALPVENAVYFCASETLANVAKHSGASRAWMNFSLSDHAVLIITDDGYGGAQILPGHGLGGLQDRAASVGGVLHISSEIGKGTVVRLEVPLR
ncbi:MAG: sensor domain-containing protein [Propionibacteriaceae bacterium]|nr:sensor domain-containing protein [Propionibacteriaceae bacterium]